MPFGGAVVSKRVIPVISFEAVESQQLPGIALDRMCRRPNFNRAPRGWGPDYCPESNELWREADRLKEAKDWNSGLWSLFSSYKDEPSVNPKAPQGRRRRKKVLLHDIQSGFLLPSGLMSWGELPSSLHTQSSPGQCCHRLISPTYCSCLSPRAVSDPINVSMSACPLLSLHSAALHLLY